MEQALLGSILLDANTVLPLCIAKITTEAFYDLRHQTLYNTMLELYDEQSPVETVTLYERLQTWGKADQVGGVSYISGLPDAVPSAANAEYYLGIIREKFLLRRMLQVNTSSVSRIYEHEGDCDELLDQIESEVLQVAETRVVSETPTALELVRNAIQNIESYHQHGGQLIGVGSGFSDIDKMTHGFRPGHMIVIAARPGVGKTSLAMNIADHVAVQLGLGVGVISLEMTGDELMERMIASRARVNLRNIQEGFLAERDMPRIVSAAGALGNAPLYIDDKSAQNILEIRAKARRWHQQHDIRLLVVDYLQLAGAGSTGRRVENRQQEVSLISRGIKLLAKELGIPVIVMSQLNRQIEYDKNRKPRLSDLRESGSIEQDADLVMFLHARRRIDDNGEEEDDMPDVVPTTGIIAKQRSGPTGEIFFTFLKAYTRFESAARISDADAPPQSEQQEQSLPYNDT